MAIALCLGMLWIKVNLPTPGIQVTPAVGGWRITKLNGETNTSGGLSATWLGTTVTRACAGAAPSQCVDLQPLWVIDSPIMLQSASAQAEMIDG